MIHLRPAAVQEIQRLLHQQSSGDLQLRIGLHPSDCAEWAYHLGSAQAIGPNDVTFTAGNLTIVVAQAIVPLIDELTIDYAEDLMGGGFRFMNPQAQHTCGCGNAFSIGSTAAAQDCQSAALLDATA